MPVTNVSAYYGDSSTPADLIQLRRSTLDYHRRFGMPAVIKHAWRPDDVANEIVDRDPGFDDVYGQSTVESTGFATGYEGGYSSGAFTYITLGDSLIDETSPSDRGLYKLLQPSGTAPWIPQIRDGDLIILVSIVEPSPGQVQITATGDRFRVQNVIPVTMRGYPSIAKVNLEYENNTQVMVTQTFQAIRFPRANPVYDVPVVP